MACATVDLSSIGTEDITPLQWYNGIINAIANDLANKSLPLSSFHYPTWAARQRTAQWEEEFGLAYRFGIFMEEEVVPAVQSPIVIFVDESDSIRSLPFKVEDFFVFIRTCYNRRADASAYQRLTFAILGVASPGDLIRGEKRTPFNIGRAIDLTGFQLPGAMPLAQGLQECAAAPTAVLQAILEWTGGPPFLTQKVCDLVRTWGKRIGVGEEAKVVEQVVREKIVQYWEMQDNPQHLRTIRDRILEGGGAAPGRLLGLYQQVELRPYADALSAWLASGSQDESRLWRGQALREALQWAAGQKLDHSDYQFLLNSQQLEEHEQRIQERSRLLDLAEKQKALAIRAVINLTYDVINKVADVSGTTPHWQAIFENNIEVLQQIEALSPDTPDAQREKAANLSFRGDVWLRLGKTDEALTAYQKSLAIGERLAAQDPNSAQAQRDVSVSYNQLGNIYLAQGQTESALTAYQKSLAIAERLAAQDPNSAQAQRDLMVSYAKLGETQIALKDKKQALQYYEQALKIAEPLVKQDPTNKEKQDNAKELKRRIAGLRGGE